MLLFSHLTTQEGFDCVPFGVPEGMPAAEALPLIVNLVKRAGIQCIAAVGEGGMLDLAKASAMLATNEGKATSFCPHLGGKNVAREPSLPTILIPTNPSGEELTVNPYVLFKQEIFAKIPVIPSNQV